MPGTSSESPRGSKIQTGKVLAAFRAAFSIAQGEVLFLAGLCSLHEWRQPSPRHDSQGVRGSQAVTSDAQLQ